MKRILIEILFEDIPINSDNVNEWLQWKIYARDTIKRIAVENCIESEKVDLHITSRRMVIYLDKCSFRSSPTLVRGPKSNASPITRQHFADKYSNSEIIARLVGGVSYDFAKVKNTKTIPKSIANTIHTTIKSLRFKCFCISNDDFNWPRPILSIMVKTDFCNTSEIEKANSMGININNYTLSNRYDGNRKHIISEDIALYLKAYKNISVILEYQSREKTILTSIPDIYINRYKDYISSSCLKYENPNVYRVESQIDHSDIDSDIIHAAAKECHSMYLGNCFAFIQENVSHIRKSSACLSMSIKQKITDINYSKSKDMAIQPNPYNILSELSKISFFEEITYKDKANIIGDITEVSKNIPLYFIDKLFNTVNKYPDLDEHLLNSYYKAYSIADIQVMHNQDLEKCKSKNIRSSMHSVRLFDDILSGTIILYYSDTPTGSNDPYGIKSIAKNINHIFTKKFHIYHKIDSIKPIIIDAILKHIDIDKTKLDNAANSLISICISQFKKNITHSNILDISRAIAFAHDFNENIAQNQKIESVILSAIKRSSFCKNVESCTIEKDHLITNHEKLLVAANCELSIHIHNITSDCSIIERSSIADIVNSLYNVAELTCNMIDNVVIETDNLEIAKIRRSLLKAVYSNMSILLN